MLSLQVNLVQVGRLQVAQKKNSIDQKWGWAIPVSICVYAAQISQLHHSKK